MKQQAILDTKLIENALALTGKEIEYIQNPYVIMDTDYDIEKFCYYLLSPEFIEKYADRINGDFFFEGQYERVAMNFGQAIYEYQSGNEKPLIELLSKIK